MFGLLAQMDIAEEENNRADTSASGVGWMFGPQVAVELITAEDYRIVPYASLSGLYDFNRLISDAAIDAVLNSSSKNFRGRVEGGVEAVLPRWDSRLQLEGFYDGIGVGDYDAYGVQLDWNLRF